MPLLTDFSNNMLGSNGTAATRSGNLADAGSGFERQPFAGAGCGSPGATAQSRNP